VDIAAEPLFYNDHIKIGNNNVIYRTWIEHGVSNISHMLHDNGTFLSNDEFNTKYNLHVNFLSYIGCIQAIKKLMKKNNVAFQNNIAATNRKALTLIFSVKKGTKKYYDILVENKQRPNCCEKWNRKLALNIDWNVTFTKMKTIKDIKLKWFQMRLVHRIIGTNISLKWMGVTNDDKCGFCNEETESIEHLFWRCSIVNRFWKDLANCLNRDCGYMDNLKLNEELILFGQTNGFISDHIFDFIFLFGKFYVYKCKLGNVHPDINLFRMQLSYRYQVEKYLASINLEYDLFEKQWRKYLPIFENLQ